MFSLPGRGFRQRVTLTSSVPMILDDVIVHVRQFIIALVSVDGCSSFLDPDGFLDMPDSSVGFLVYNAHSLPVYDVVFSCRMVNKGRFIYGRHHSFFLCISLFSCCLHPFCVPPVVFLVVFLSPQCTQHHSSCMVFGTPVHPVLLALLCPWDVPTSVGTHGCCYSIFLQYLMHSL